MTKLLNEIENLNSVADHAAILKSAVVSTGVLPWLLKLTALSDQPMIGFISDCNLNSVKPYPIKAFNACDDDNVDADGTYVQPYLLDAVASKIKATPIHTAINNSWKQHHYYNLLIENGFEHGINAETYTGDEDSLKQVIDNMLKAWNHKNSAIPVSIVIPLEQDHWDCFHFDEKATADFLSSPYGKISMVSLLQLFNLQDNFIDAFLRLAGITYPKSKEELASLIPLNQRYQDAKSNFNGYCLSPNIQQEIQSLMKGDDKLNTNEFTPVIPRMASSTKNDDLKFGVLSAIKFQEREGYTATENDLAKIREGVSYCMTSTGGIVITFDIPVIDESIRMGRCSTPILIAPKTWLEVIKANRPSNNRQDDVDTIPNKKANETGGQAKRREATTARIKHKLFVKPLLDQTIDKSDKAIQRCYPAPIANR